MKKAIVAGVLLAFVFFSACGGNEKPQPAGDSAAAAGGGGSTDGKALFEANCQSCHGADGKAGVGGAADLSASKLDHATAVSVVTSGRNMMQGFKGRLNASEIDAVVSYVETLRK